MRQLLVVVVVLLEEEGCGSLASAGVSVPVFSDRRLPSSLSALTSLSRLQ